MVKQSSKDRTTRCHYGHTSSSSATRSFHTHLCAGAAKRPSPWGDPHSSKLHSQCVDCVCKAITIQVQLHSSILCNTLQAQQCPAARGGLKLLYCCSSACGGLHTLCCVWARGEVCRERHSPANKKEGFLFIYLQILTVIVEMIAAVPLRPVGRLNAWLNSGGKKRNFLSCILFLFFSPLHPYLLDIYHKRQSGHINRQQIFLTNRCPASVYSDW